MLVEIRPAIYGENGIRYEAFRVIKSASFWKGETTTFERLYFEKRGSRWVPTDYCTWSFGVGDSRRSTKTIKKLISMLNDSYGASYSLRSWRPPTQEQGE